MGRVQYQYHDDCKVTNGWASSSYYNYLFRHKKFQIIISERKSLIISTQKLDYIRTNICDR